MKAVKLLLKIVLWTVLTVVLLVVALVMTMQWWFGPAVKLPADRFLPTITKTPFRFGRLMLNPYSGRLEVGNVYLGNPTNYDEKCAASVGLFVVDTDPVSLASDIIHIEELTVSNVLIAISYTDGWMNFEQIQYNATGGEVDADVLNSDDDKKVIIDSLNLSGLKLDFGLVRVPIPTITLTDIGKDSGGVYCDDLADAIVDHIIHISPASTNAYHTLRAKALNLGPEAPPPEKHVRHRKMLRRSNFGAGGHDF